MIQEVGQFVDQGLHRNKNEDSIATFHPQQSLGIYALADGVGGDVHGEIASKMAVQSAMFYFADNIRHSGNSSNSDDCRRWLYNAFSVANHQIYKWNQMQLSPARTTLVMAAMIGERAYVANVGDSRAYHIHSEGIKQITKDHSFVQELVGMGRITEEEARTHPRRNIIMRSVGGEECVSSDFYKVAMQPNDYLLLCSDGLTNELSDETIFEYIQQSDSSQDTCERLVAAANAAGGRDNISVIIVKLRDGKKSWQENAAKEYAF